jgi:hypothetical protein
MARRFTFDSQSGNTVPPIFIIGGAVVLVSIVLLPIFVWTCCYFEVPTQHIAVLTRKTGKELANVDELAPSAEYKGVQKEVLGAGYHFRNPWHWDWQIVPFIEIPQNKVGVRIRLYGDDPPYGEVIAWRETEKGIVPEVLGPGLYPYNAIIAGEERTRDNYAEIIELHDRVTVPAGFRGVVTNLSGPMPGDANRAVLSPADKGKRGVEAVALDAGTYVGNSNPYLHRVSLVDCRSQRFDLSKEGDMGFPSKDGFWVTLDGVIEFRVMPERAAEVFVTFNEVANDKADETDLHDEIEKKILLPNARAFCRLRGSDHAGREFIGERTQFQQDFMESMEAACESQGIEIVQAVITDTHPPAQIMAPVQLRQLAVEQRQQYSRELIQQESEKQLAIEREMNERRQALVEAQRNVIQMTTEAQQAQGVALIEANKRLRVAELELQAATDLAAATLARGSADAKVIQFQNEAEAAGWRKAVEAFGGNGEEYARWTMLKKLAPAFRSMMVNTADSPIMEIFRQYEKQSQPVSGVRTAGSP